MNERTMIQDIGKVNQEYLEQHLSMEGKAFQYRARLNSNITHIVNNLLFLKELIDASIAYLKNEDLETAGNKVYSLSSSASAIFTNICRMKESINGVADSIKHYPLKNYCKEHDEQYQELWAGTWLCETCFVAAHQYNDEGLERCSDE